MPVFHAEDIVEVRAVGAGDLAGALAAAVDAAARKFRAGGRVDGVALFLVVPAEATSNEAAMPRSSISFFIMNSAMGERQILPRQTNSTRIKSISSVA